MPTTEDPQGFDLPRLAGRVEDLEICLKGDLEKPGKLRMIDDHEKRITSIERAMAGAVKGIWTLVAMGFIGIISFIWNVVVG